MSDPPPTLRLPPPRCVFAGIKAQFRVVSAAGRATLQLRAAAAAVLACVLLTLG